MIIHVSTKSADYWPCDTLGEINLHRQRHQPYLTVGFSLDILENILFLGTIDGLWRTILCKEFKTGYEIKFNLFNLHVNEKCVWRTKL